MKSSIIAAGVIYFSSIVFSGTAHAIHKGAGNLVCGGCHTVHNSQGGVEFAGTNPGGSLLLLRGPVSTRAEIHKFCLQCHASNGTQANTLQPPQNVKAPKVWSTATWTSDDPFNMIGSGGNFSPELDASWNVTTGDVLGKGHSLGTTNITPPGGDLPIDTFSCINCHDPHGTTNTASTDINIFRNLRVNARGAGANANVKFSSDTLKPWLTHKSYVGGVNGSYFGGSETDNAGQVIWPIYRGTLTGNPVTDGPNSNAYATNLFATAQSSFELQKDRISMSNWCAQCHDKWHEGQNLNRTDGGDPDFAFGDRIWTRHPVDAEIPRKASVGCADGCHPSMLDRGTYTTALIATGKGLPVTTSSWYTGNVYYLPYLAPCVPGAVNCMDTPLPGKGNHKVFCLSCHFAHGGPYNDNLRWDYTSSVSAAAQTGNGVPSNKGCQLCHNRGA